MSAVQRRAVPLGGARLEYEVIGADRAGPPVVLLHPWFGCTGFWWATIDRLPNRRLLTVDLYSPGQGPWGAVASPEGLAGGVLAILAAEGLGQVDLVGNSLGGIIAQEVASRAPARIRRLVLVGTGARTEGVLPGFAAAVGSWIARAGTGEPVPRGEVAELVGMLVTRRPDPVRWEQFIDAVTRADPAYLAAVLAAARELDLTPRLPAITAPTLVVRGEHDCARTPAHVAALVAGIADARAVELPGAGHSPMVDRPDEFVARLEAHLSTAH